MKRTKPNPGMAARIRRIAMMNAQVRLDSFGNDGIFMIRPLYAMEVPCFSDLGQGNFGIIPGYTAARRVKIGRDQCVGVYTVSLFTPPD